MKYTIIFIFIAMKIQCCNSDNTIKNKYKLELNYWLKIVTDSVI